MHNAPCMNCDKREVGCHSHCLSYLSFKLKVHRERIKREEENRSYRTLHDDKYPSVTRSIGKVPR